MYVSPLPSLIIVGSDKPSTSSTSSVVQQQAANYYLSKILCCHSLALALWTIIAGIDKIKQQIDHFKSMFNELKRDLRDGLTKKEIHVRQVVNALADLTADDVDEHKQFLDSHLSVYYQANDHAELIGQLSFHMNYLSYHLLDYLGNEFDLVEVKGKMTIYKSDLQQFRKKTPLALFCRAQRRFHSSFKKAVMHFEWTNSTLEDVVQFQQEYAAHYKLRECAMMISEIRSGSYIITWFIPESVVEKLKAKLPREILQKHCVTKLEIAGACVYYSHKDQKVSGADCNGSV